MAAAIDRDQPRFIEEVRAHVAAQDDATRALHRRNWQRHLVAFVAERRPAALPDSVRAAVAGGDPAPLEGYLDLIGDDVVITAGFLKGDVDVGEQHVKLGAAPVDAKGMLFDPQRRRLTLDTGMVFGPWGRLLGGVTTFIAYFTIWTWLLRGHTPGKALFKVRVVRLDGRRIGLWDSFGRAGGYSASFATAGLGFLETFWHPNRQSVHDRIAGTVVIRSSTGGRRRPRTAAGDVASVEGP